MKFCEDRMKGENMIKMQNLLFSVKGAITQKIGNPDLWFLHSACRLMLVYICVKFQKSSSNSFHVIDRHKFVIDRWMAGWMDIPTFMCYVVTMFMQSCIKW